MMSKSVPKLLQEANETKKALEEKEARTYSSAFFFRQPLD